ncbi:MAG: DUF454 domain-containing protein [Clostridiales bacterium]|nr:DUF454 domain-containing protein [Clostridiales bacterium]
MIKKYLFIALGFIFLTLGVIGIVFPVLPTTPFLLLTSYFFVRSSDKLYQWLIHHKVFGAYIYNYVKYKAIRMSAKIMALLMIWITIPLCLIFFLDNIFVRVMLFIIASIVSVYILSLKTLKGEPEKAPEEFSYYIVAILDV